MSKQRLRFCEGAMSCFRRKGIAATSLTDICNEVGLSMGAFYKHFTARDELILEIVKLRISRRSELLIGKDWAELRSKLLMFRRNLEEDSFARELRGLIDWNERLMECRISAKHSLLLQIEEQLRRFEEKDEVRPRFDLHRTANLVTMIFDGSLVDLYAVRGIEPVLDELREFLDFAVGATPPEKQSERAA